MSISGYHNYRGYLRDLLIERKKKNPQFSLRSFARLLGVQPAFLSYILNGKRDLSDEMISQFIEKLGLSERDAKTFDHLVKIERTKNPSLKKRLLESLHAFDPARAVKRDLTVDQFVMLSEWYHFAVFMLLDLPGFEWSSSAAAKALGISVFELEQALERMAALELVEYAPGTPPRKLESRLIFESKKHNDALKKFHRQNLEKARTALVQYDPTQRYSGTEILTLGTDQLPEAVEIFKECYQKVFALAKKAKRHQEVFSLGIHLFPLSQTQSKKGVKK